MAKLLLLAMSFISPSWCAWTRVQKVHNYPGGSGSYTITAGSSITAGSLVAVNTGFSISSGAFTISASGGSNAWTCATSPASPLGAGGAVTAWCWAQNANAGALTVTVSCTGATDMGGELIEYSGILTASALDGSCTINTPTGSTTPTSGSFTYTSGDLLLAGIADETQVSPTITGGAGYTLINADNTHDDAQEEGTATGSSQTATFGWTPTSTTGNGVMLVCGFKITGGASKPPGQFPRVQ